MSLNWYVLRAISGKENKIKTYLEKEINRNKLEKFIPEVMIPYEKVYVMRNGKKKIKCPSTGGVTRTPNQRFWRPLLYQLSYTRITKMQANGLQI